MFVHVLWARAYYVMVYVHRGMETTGHAGHCPIFERNVLLSTIWMGRLSVKIYCLTRHYAHAHICCSHMSRQVHVCGNICHDLGVKRPVSFTSRNCGSKRLCSLNCSSSSPTEDSELDRVPQCKYSSKLPTCNLSKLASIGIVLPVSSVACEHGFSIQNLIKTTVRSSLNVDDIIY